ncbi:acetyl-CoA hydrolase/transferase family protein [Aminipila luticellarii]|uniref:Acetyl-CoA hydrolase/transferase family protein n=1 Tax=Aminipila luticellarii TaxID=2507160 RepID=A0A410PUN4_9FIRM|nr:acetyl-CoA hydrolase/transferase C-terminal domain-containing protein [Aminipila luticellarii]QAT42634.1 acetyl-CoA hydrolase/transferase family protein [Aminipila luticellarii]
MGWQEQYRTCICTPEEAVSHIKDGDVVFLGHAVGEPKVLVDAMVANAESYHGVIIKHMVSLGSGAYAAPDLKEHFTASPIFASANVRAAIEEGMADFIPMFFHEVPIMIRKGKLKCDVLMTQVTPPDQNGYCSLGTSVDYTFQALKSAGTVIVQMNDQLPRTFGEKVHISELDYIVEASVPLYESKPAVIGETEMAIGKHCVSLIEDQSTLQLGIGGIPDAVVQMLGDRKDLGIHSEMIADGTIQLYEKGVITGRYKTENKWKMTVTFLMGTKKLYDFAHNNPEVEVRPVDYVNHPAVVMRQHRMVAINSAIQTDLMGQIVADTIGKRQFSGVGGQVDFVRGAAMAEDGKSIIAMPSFTQKRDGRILSKIVPFIDEGAAVTTSRNDIDYIITENGVAEMKGKTLRERAKNLIQIAHESVKEELRYEFERRFHEKPFSMRK